VSQNYHVLNLYVECPIYLGHSKLLSVILTTFGFSFKSQINKICYSVWFLDHTHTHTHRIYRYFSIEIIGNEVLYPCYSNRHV